MTSIHFRVAHFEGEIGLDAVVVVIGVLCAGVLLTSFVGAVKTSVQRGEALRETQRAGIAAPRNHNAANITNAVLPIRQVAVAAE